MARRHSSFLVRCWDLGSDDEERIEIEHIQSGTKKLARSVADAMEWIYERSGESPQPREAATDGPVSMAPGTGKGGADG